MCRSLALMALLLAGCPGPGPVEPEPRPHPEASCDDACAQLDALECPVAGPGCIDTCERYEELGGALSWNPGCIAQAESCDAAELCRGGQ